MHDPATHVASWLSTSADPTPADDGHAQILALFRDWLAVPQASPVVLVKRRTEQSSTKSCAKMEDGISPIPASGAAGLGIKIYISCWWDDQGDAARRERVSAVGDRLFQDRREGKSFGVG